MTALRLATPGLYVRNAVVDNTAGNVMVPVLLGGPEGAPSTSTVTVDYTTANGSATAGTDYTTTSGTLTFGPGQTAQNIVVPIIDRSGAAPSRSFRVNLSSPTNAVITQGTGVVTIGASGGTAVSSPNISAPANTVVGEADGYIDLACHLECAGHEHGHGELRDVDRRRLRLPRAVRERHAHLRPGGDPRGGPGALSTTVGLNGRRLASPSHCRARRMARSPFRAPRSPSRDLPRSRSSAPRQGPCGTVVTITGTNLEGAVSVTFNGKSAKISQRHGHQPEGQGPCQGHYRQDHRHDSGRLRHEHEELQSDVRRHRAAVSMGRLA